MLMPQWEAEAVLVATWHVDSSKKIHLNLLSWVPCVSAANCLPAELAQYKMMMQIFLILKFSKTFSLIEQKCWYLAVQALSWRKDVSRKEAGLYSIEFPQGYLS